MDEDYRQSGDNYEVGIPFGLTGIVAENDDPLHMARVRVVIPALSEEEVCEKWIRPLVGAVTREGHGFVSIPMKGTEVALWSRAGGKHELFYTTQYNEAAQVPEDVPDETVTLMRFPCDGKIIMPGDLYIKAGNIIIESDSEIQYVAPGGHFHQLKREEEG